MKNSVIRRDNSNHISKKVYIPTFCGVALAITAIALSLQTSKNNQVINDSSVLIKKNHFSVSLQKDEAQELPQYTIKLKFVTQHFAPVRNCTVTQSKMSCFIIFNNETFINIKLTIDDEVFYKTHDANGVVTHKGQFKRSITDDQFPIQIEITSGKGENTLTNKLQKDLIKNTSNPNLYELDDQIIYKPNLPKETHIIGRVVDEYKQPVAKAKVIVSIYSPVFQDYTTEYTDGEGKFNVLLYLEQLTPIYGDLTIEAEGFATWNIMRDTKYKNGFYIINHLYFEFKEDIVLTKGRPELAVSGFVQEHKTSQPYSGSAVSMECQAKDNPSNKQTFDIGVSGEDGSFKFREKSNFKNEEEIICTVLAKPKSGSPLYEGRTQVTLFKSKRYTAESVMVYVTTKPITGYIKGKFVSETSGEPIPDLTVKFITTSQIKINPPPVKTNEQGEFILNLTGYESEQKYEGYLAIESDIYDPDAQYPVTLKEENSYIVDAGEIKARQIPKPQKIIIKGALFEQTNKEPLNNYDFSIIITNSNKKVDTIPTKTDSDGMFSYEFTGKNNETYKIQLYAPANENFQELNEVRELGPNKPLKFDADFKKVYLKRAQTNGKISGYIFDQSTDKPIENAKINVLTDIPLPEQEIKCTNQAGNFNCDFIVEKYQKYNAQIQVVTDVGMTGKADVGELNMDNKYTVTDAKLGIKFEIVPIKGIISGQVINGETDQIITEGTYKVVSIDPPSENQDQILNKEIPYEKEGRFKIELDIHVGPKYVVKVVFTSPKLVENETIFELNYQNKYKIDQKVLLGMPLNGFVDGHVKTKLQLPVADALVKVYVENYSSPFSAKTDGKGYYKVRIPASSTQQVVKAKITAEKNRFKLYTSNIEFLKEKNYQNENFDIVLDGEFWKSNFSGKIIDENSQPVPFCSLSVTLKDSFKEPTTDLPYSTVSLLTGEYVFDLDVSYNDNYTGYFVIKCNFFKDQVEIFELNTQNHYQIENRLSKVERNQIPLDFSGTVLNTLNQPVPGTSISLIFDYDSHSHNVKDMNIQDINGKFDLKQKILDGYVYKARAEIKIQTSEGEKDYQSFTLELEFNPYNNYKIYKDIEILKKFTASQISGQIFDSETQQPIQNAQAILHFTQKEFSKYSVFVYTNEEGKFEIKKEIQQGFEYKAKADGKHTGYKDSSVDILLNSQNNYQVADIKIYLTKAVEADYVEGYIHGHGRSISGDPLPNSKVETYTEVDPSTKYTVNTDADGLFLLPNMKLIKGNVYAFVVELSPSDPNFNKRTRRIHLSENDDYQYNNLTLNAERIRVKYTIKGKVGDKKSGLNLGGCYVIVTFINQQLIENAFSYSNKDGEFTLNGTVAKGLNYDGKFVIIHAGFETLTPQFTFMYNQSDNPNENYVKTDANFSLIQNPFQKLYYVDERNVIPVRSKVYERTTCKLYPNKYLPFVKVSLYIENRQGQEGTLIAETYTTLKGDFLINAPRPLFSDIQTYLVFERQGYMQLKEYQRIAPNSQFIEQGPQQINNRHGISDCSKKQRKIQNKFDKV